MTDKISMTLDQTALAEGFAALILKEMGPEQRERILTQALTHIIEPQKLQYGGTGPSILQHAFNQALATLTNRVATEIVEADPAFTEAVRLAVTEAMAKALENHGYGMKERIADALVHAVYLRGDDG